ncbi:unnamed protein product [Cuscuta campestris]|uniref:CCHC-type domain-containing protein n=1 Tax=Cuscuta campestris TaxID=132261 RepID=A0A484KJV3_9ASTE|nr:unnamed protein product [Cuscuta campestris]
MAAVSGAENPGDDVEEEALVRWGRVNRRCAAVADEVGDPKLSDDHRLVVEDPIIAVICCDVVTADGQLCDPSKGRQINLYVVEIDAAANGVPVTAEIGVESPDEGGIEARAALGDEWPQTRRLELVVEVVVPFVLGKQLREHARWRDRALGKAVVKAKTTGFWLTTHPAMGRTSHRWVSSPLAKPTSRTMPNSDGKLYPLLFKPWSNIITRQNALTQRWEALPIDGNPAMGRLNHRWEGMTIGSHLRKGIFLRVEVLECGISEQVLLGLVGLEFSGCNGLLSTQVPMKKVGDKLIPKTEDEFDAEDIKKVENYAKAINMLYCAVNPDDYRKISCCSTAKEMWDKLEVTYEGTDQVREAKIDFLTQEYEMFRMKEHVKIDDMFDRFSKIVNDLLALKRTYTDRDLVRKILRSLTSEWRSKADAIYESIGTSNVTIDGLRAFKEPTMNDSSDDDEVKLVMKRFCKFLRKKEKVEDGPVCYGCGEAGNIKNKCPRNGRNTRHFKRQRAYISWGGDSGDESTDQDLLLQRLETEYRVLLVWLLHVLHTW